MQRLSAIDAISPAFTRTNETLFRPFRVGRSWKLAASSYVAFAGSVFVPFFLVVFLIPKDQLGALSPFRTAIILGGSVLSLLLLYVFYLCARMELVAFEMVVTRAQFIRPMWRHYSVRVWPWLWLKVALGTAVTGVAAALAYRPVKELIASIPSSGSTSNGLPVSFSYIFLVFALIYGLLLALKVVSTVLHDFVMPFYILEDITLHDALRHGFAVLIGEPLTVLGYLLMKLVLSIVGFIFQYAATLVCFIPFYIVMTFGVVIGSLVGHKGGLVATVLLVCLAVLFYIAFMAWSIYTSIGTLGYVLTWLTAYGIYFLGGRYSLLGNILDPGIGAPFTPPPVYPSDDERGDDDGGPPMPMNPAVA